MKVRKQIKDFLTANVSTNGAFHVVTKEDNDGYKANHEYIFLEEELIKFITGEIAAEYCGDERRLGYYEIIQSITLQADIDLEELYRIRNLEVDNA